MAELPEHVTLRQGAEVTLRLPSLAGAGYRWQATADDDAVVEATTRFGEATGHETNEPAFAAFELLVLRGRRVGTTRVHCSQRRGWEAEAAPAAEQIVAVDVVPDVSGESTTTEGPHES
jgi:predicted secreted protein